MKSLDIPLVGLLLLFSVQLTAAFRLQNTALTNEDMDVLKLLLQRLEESVPVPSQEQTMPRMEEGEANLEDTRIKPPPDTGIKQYLSVGNLRTVRKDSKRHSRCFGRKIDRIGSMSSLGCNTIGQSGPKNK